MAAKRDAKSTDPVVNKTPDPAVATATAEDGLPQVMNRDVPDNLSFDQVQAAMRRSHYEGNKAAQAHFSGQVDRIKKHESMVKEEGDHARAQQKKANETGATQVLDGASGQRRIIESGAVVDDPSPLAAAAEAKAEATTKGTKPWDQPST